MNRTFFLIIVLTVITKADAQEASALAVGDSLFALGNYNQAITYYKKADDVDEKIARAHAAVGNTTKALQFYEVALKKGNAGVLTNYNYGKLLLKSGRYKKASEVFKTLTKENPKNPEFQYQLGLVQEKSKDSTYYLSYSYALQLDQSHQNALFKLAKYRAEKRNFNGAMSYVAKGLEVAPNSIRFLSLKAVIEFVNKSYHKAANTYEKLLELNQSNERLHQQLAVSYNQTNRFEKAIQQYTILINEYDDKNPSWHFNIAKNFAALRYLDKAQHHYEISIALLDLPLDESYLALSSVFNKKKEYKNQFSTLQKAVHENPKNQRAKYFLATAADNYFEDDLVVIPYYEQYLETFGDNGRYAEFAKARIRDLKTDIHLNKN